VIPGQIAVPKANEAFNEDGTLRDAKLGERVDKLVGEFVSVTSRLLG
jgi:hypothetical protein